MSSLIERIQRSIDSEMTRRLEEDYETHFDRDLNISFYNQEDVDNVISNVEYDVFKGNTCRDFIECIIESLENDPEALKELRSIVYDIYKESLK